MLIIDGFLDAEIAAIVKQMPCPSEAVDGGGIIIGGRSYGKEARADVDVGASVGTHRGSLVARLRRAVGAAS